MFIFDLFNLKSHCTHDHVSIESDGGYCPTCGKFVRNDWYITRCASCGVKLKTIIKNGVVMPQNHFCTNCGSKEFVEERLEKINFVDINFAVLKKTVVEACEPHVFTQCWEEKTNWQPKLLTQS